jgi:hypothetical protein
MQLFLVPIGDAGLAGSIALEGMQRLFAQLRRLNRWTNGLAGLAHPLATISIRAVQADKVTNEGIPYGLHLSTDDFLPGPGWDCGGCQSDYRSARIRKIKRTRSKVDTFRSPSTAALRVCSYIDAVGFLLVSGQELI